MINTVMCENCAHKDVCKHRDEFTDIQKQFNNFKVFSNVGDKSAIKGTIVPIESLSYIEVPMLKCTHFLERNVVYNRRSNIE